MLWLIILLCVLIGASIGMLVKPSEVSFEVKEIVHSALSTGIAFGIIGAIIGALVSIFPLLRFGVASTFGMLIPILIGAGSFFIAGFLITFAVKSLSNLLPPRMAGALMGSFFGLIAGLILFSFFTPAAAPGAIGEYFKLLEPIKEKTIEFGKEIAKFKYCFSVDPRCPFFVSWEEPKVQQTEEKFEVKVKFSDTRIYKDSINLLVALTVNNPELYDVKIKPKCYLGKDKRKELKINMQGAYWKGDEFVFPPSSSPLHTSFRCQGIVEEASEKAIHADDVIVTLERPVEVEVIWPIWIGDEPRIGRVKSEMKFNAPYLVSLGSENDMPFSEGSEYDFSVIIKRKDEKVKLLNFEDFIIEFPETVLAECQGFEATDHSLELSQKNLDYESLKEISIYNPKLEKFSFPCSLYVTNAPITAVKSLIEARAYYSVISEYKTQILKSP